MSDNLDDDISLDDSFDDFEKKQSTLGDLLRENPLFKIGAIAAAAVLIFAVISMFGGDEKPIEESYIGAAPDIKAAPGTEEAPRSYVDAIEELNEADVERALKENDSSLPVPIEPPIGRVDLPEDETEEEDPLQRWRRLQEERLEREIQQRDTNTGVDASADAARQEAIQALADAMSEQMSSILESKTPTSLSSMQLTDPEFLIDLHNAQNAEDEASEDELLEDGEVSGDVSGEVLLPAAEILYAQLLIEANSDVPGPVLAEIMSGPLKGSRILGSFEVQEELLTLVFDTVVYEEKSIGIDAIALDPETTLPGLATEVDHRYFKRVVLPAAAAFVEGLTTAIAESGRTTITVQGETVTSTEEDADTDQEVASGLSEAGQELGEILGEMADDTEVLVRIAVGTPIGVLFLEPVVNEEGP
ncbi:MAG: type IV secretion protein DotG [Alphaproteobacteria bacterium]